MARRFAMIAALVLTLTGGISDAAWSADKPVTLRREERTTLRVGEHAVLRIPSDGVYLESQVGPSGAWRDVLKVVRVTRREILFRAVRDGRGVVIFTPETNTGDCVSCVTVHYFIEVASQK